MALKYICIAAAQGYKKASDSIEIPLHKDLFQDRKGAFEGIKQA